ncbi:MAG: class IV adenylate cyclase [Anaerolineae bacterium]|nr:class IV adenylate cyclase [Anaerolineae bacterium]
MQNEYPQEMEGKWLIRDRDALVRRVEAAGGVRLHERVLEMNLRFDDAENLLQSRLQVLRLRMDHQARMTFKGPADYQDGVSRRTEIEFTVSDFTAARHLLEALGYSVCFTYEKYRTEYRLGGCVIMLDELPLGHFVEIEGNKLEEIKTAADLLHLNWHAQAQLSYTALFTLYNQKTGRELRDLTFKAFSSLVVEPHQLELEYGDEV